MSPPLALAAGLALGLLHFGGLWLTLRRLATGPRPLAAVVAGFLLRSALTLALLYPALAGGWGSIAAALAGFAAARLPAVRLLPALLPLPGGRPGWS